MAIPEGATRQRLAALGIDVWVRRDRVVKPIRPTEPAISDPVQPGAAADRLRVRMASGSGEWLLVQPDPWSGKHEQLLADITATIGADRCRFGQWAVSESAGISLGDLGERGVGHVLAFGQPPRPVCEEFIHLVPTLNELAADGQARRRLWKVLSSLVGR